MNRILAGILLAAGLAAQPVLAQSIGGTVGVRSKLGEGSVFTVFLPAAPAENQAKPPLPEPVTEML